jgi:hypothetical protein
VLFEYEGQEEQVVAEVPEKVPERGHTHTHTHTHTYTVGTGKGGRCTMHQYLYFGSASVFVLLYDSSKQTE